MADNKKKEADGNEGEGKKKGLPAVALIAAGAVLGGAGVVFAVPPKVVEVEVEQEEFEPIDVIHPDVLDFTFNPTSKTGRGVASFKFRFVYTVREDLEEEAFHQIEERWLQAKSNLLMILTSRSVEELRTEAGMKMLERAMIDDLDRTLFEGHGDERTAEVTRIMWEKTLFQ